MARTMVRVMMKKGQVDRMRMLMSMIDQESNFESIHQSDDDDDNLISARRGQVCQPGLGGD